MLVVQGNLASTYGRLGRHEDALRMRQEVYSGRLKLNGAEHLETLREAINYALDLKNLNHFKEVKTLLRKTMPAARRVLGDSHEFTLSMRSNYTTALYRDSGATLDDLREAVTTLEDVAPTARRVLGGTHPTTMDIETCLRNARAALRARETPPPRSA